jgi:hypothetical protein
MGINWAEMTQLDPNGTQNFDSQYFLNQSSNLDGVFIQWSIVSQRTPQFQDFVQNDPNDPQNNESL